MSFPAVLPTPADLRRVTAATYLVFIGSGFAFASWASRIPQLRDRLELQPAELGLLLLAVAAGSLIAFPLAGSVVGRWGSRRTVAGMAMLMAVALVVVAFGYESGVVPVAAGLFLLGFANGAWDVAMNVHGARVEGHAGRSIMPRFHAGFSVGTVAGAAVGTAVVALGVPVAAHLVTVALTVAVVVPRAAGRFLPDQPSAPDPTDTTRTTGTSGTSDDPRAAPWTTWKAWTEWRTLRVGVFVLAFAFAEGTANNWIGVALIDGHDVSPAVGTLAFAVFLAAMTTGRWVGPVLLDRYGRVPVVRCLALLAVVGLALFVLGPSTPVAFLGAVLWGAGVSLGFPVGMSAGADDPQRAAARVSVIASIGYCSFLAGPPLIGFLGQEFGVLRALTIVALLLAVAALLAGAVAPPGQTPTTLNAQST